MLLHGIPPPRDSKPFTKACFRGEIVPAGLGLPDLTSGGSGASPSVTAAQVLSLPAVPGHVFGVLSAPAASG